MPYQPEKDPTLRKLQAEVRQINRQLKMHFDPHKFDQLFVLHARIKERVEKQSRKHGAPLGWES